MLKQSNYVVEGKTVSFEYEAKPDFLTIIGIINEVVDLVFDDTVGYTPYLVGYWTDYTIIRALTQVELPEDVNKCYEFIYSSGVIRPLKKDLGNKYKFIQDNISELVEFRKQRLMHESKLDVLLTSLDKFVKTFAKEFEGVDIKETLDRMEQLKFLPNLSDNEIVKAIVEMNKGEQQS